MRSVVISSGAAAMINSLAGDARDHFTDDELHALDSLARGRACTLIVDDDEPSRVRGRAYEPSTE